MARSTIPLPRPRRHRTAEEKNSILAEAAETSLRGTAQRHGIAESQLRRWREFAAMGTLADDPPWMAPDWRRVKEQRAIRAEIIKLQARVAAFTEEIANLEDRIAKLQERLDDE